MLKQFFLAAEQRNEKLKGLIQDLQAGNNETGESFVAKLSTCSEEAEVDIELVKKLLPFAKK